MRKTSRFTGKLGSRNGDRRSGIEDRLKKPENKINFICHCGPQTVDKFDRI